MAYINRVVRTNVFLIASALLTIFAQENLDIAIYVGTINAIALFMINFLNNFGYSTKRVIQISNVFLIASAILTLMLESNVDLISYVLAINSVAILFYNLFDF